MAIRLRAHWKNGVTHSESTEFFRGSKNQPRNSSDSGTASGAVRKVEIPVKLLHLASKNLKKIKLIFPPWHVCAPRTCELPPMTAVRYSQIQMRCARKQCIVIQHQSCRKISHQVALFRGRWRDQSIKFSIPFSRSQAFSEFKKSSSSCNASFMNVEKELRVCKEMLKQIFILK